MNRPIRILGIDPGLRRTGWGMVAIAGNALSFLGCGSVTTNDRDALAARLGAQARWFHSIERPDSGPFWEHNRLLFASTEEVKKLIAQLIKVQPFLGAMASDPSLRGLADTLSLTMKGVTSDQAAPEELRTSIRTLAGALQDLSSGKPRFFRDSSILMCT